MASCNCWLTVDKPKADGRNKVCVIQQFWKNMLHSHLVEQMSLIKENNISQHQK
jgi:hypothetical protein